MKQLNLFVLAIILAMGTLFQVNAQEVTTLKLTYDQGLKGCVTKMFLNAALLNPETGEKYLMSDPVQDEYKFINLAGKGIYAYVAPNGFDIVKVIKKVPGKDDVVLTKAGSALSPYYGFNTIAGETEVELYFQGPAAPEIEYRDVTVYTNMADGLALTTAIGGEALDLGEGVVCDEPLSRSDKYSSINWEAGSYKKYVVPVDKKKTLLFYESKDGYYIPAIFQGSNSIDTSATAGVDLPSGETTLYIDVKELKRDNVLNVYYNKDESVTAHVLKTNKAIDFHLVENYIFEDSYTKVMFDPAVDVPMSFNFAGVEDNMAETPNPKYAVYLNNEELAFDDSNVVVVNAKNNDVLRVFDNVLPEKVAVRVNSNIAGAEMAFDNGSSFSVCPLDGFEFAQSSYSVLKGTQLVVTPPANCVVSANGVELTATDGKFVCDANEEMTVINITYNGTKNIPVVTPDNKETVEKLDEFIISFPEAQKVEFAYDLDTPTFNAPIIFKRNDNTFAPISYTFSRVSDNSFSVTYNAGEAVAAPGKYTLVVGANSFLIDNEVLSADLDVEYNLDYEVEVNYTVVPGEVIYYKQDWGNGFTAEIHFAQGTNVKVVDPTNAMLAFQKSGQDEPVELEYCSPDAYDKDWTMMAEGNVLMIGSAANTDWMENGFLTLVLGEEAIQLNGKPFAGLEFVWEFKDVAPKEEHTMIATPESGSTVTSLQEIVLDFPNDDFADIWTPAMFEIWKNGKFMSYGVNKTVTAEKAEQGYRVVIKISTKLEPADYVIIIREGAIVFDLLGYDGISETRLQYTLKDIKHDIVLNESEGGGIDLKNIEFVIENVETAEVANPNGITLTSNDGTYHEIGTITKVTDTATRAAAATHKFKVSFANLPSEAQGNYTLAIEPGTFTVENTAYPTSTVEKAITNISTGVEGIFGEGVTFNVITIDGKVLLKDADASDVNGLAKGVYIINGKKVVKK